MKDEVKEDLTLEHFCEVSNRLEAAKTALFKLNWWAKSLHIDRYKEARAIIEASGVVESEDLGARK